MSYLNYDYKKKKNGNQIVSIRDIGENSLLEVELKVTIQPHHKVS
ncbi:hypothetical protein [Geobacillus stearothermophilus]|nr:hypothetical protein [Geobacillus stearothermophilus]